MVIDVNKILYQIDGNKNNISRLLLAVNNSKDSRSWIIEGPKGVGKALLSRLIASDILEITKSANHLNKDFLIHQDFFLLQKNESKKIISVEEIRKLRLFFSKTSFNGKARVAIIDSINDINNYGHNAILKIIEEPPENSFIFLIDHLTSIIPATIKSRCRIFKLRELTQNNIIEILQKKDRSINLELAQSYALLARGSIGECFFLIKNNAIELYKELCFCISKIENYEDKNILNFVDLINKDKNKENLIYIFFSLIIYLINKIIKFKANILNAYCSQEEEKTVAYMQKFSFDKLYSITNLINYYKNNYFYLNTNLHSTLYSLLIEIHKTMVNK